MMIHRRAVPRAALLTSTAMSTLLVLLLFSSRVREGRSARVSPTCTGGAGCGRSRVGADVGEPATNSASGKRVPLLLGDSCELGVFCEPGTRSGMVLGVRRGFATENQDAVLVLKDAPCAGWHSYAVFDGHGFDVTPLPGLVLSGAYASKATRRFFARRLIGWPEADCAGFDDHYDSFFRWLFSAADSALPTFNGGTTATLVVYDPGAARLYTAHVGDSRALLVTQNEFGEFLGVRLTLEDHRPCPGSAELERLRREGYGECVSGDHLHGTTGYDMVRRLGWIAVTRAIGDHQYDAYGKIAQPDTGKLQLDDSARFLIVASDGLWDFVAESTVRQTAAAIYQVSNGCCEAIAKSLGNMAHMPTADGGSDDTSVVVANLVASTAKTPDCGVGGGAAAAAAAASSPSGDPRMGPGEGSDDR
eukprot:GHVU01072211.1.p1 GENE.GHVU01072211.1~~GHVU01072211.1.p1  ORF type:complete len:419 (-),score=73.63 GHVU01072211.1:630-1886(-)